MISSGNTLDYKKISLFQPEDLGMPDSPLSQAALVTSALPLLGIGYNVFQGDTDVSISPMLGVNVDPATGSFMPSIAANVQVKRINGLLQDLF